MKFAIFTAFASLLAAVSAQNANIAQPKDGSSITPGQQLTIEIDRPNTLTPSTEIAIVLSLANCGTGDCPDPASTLGPTLYSGPFKPQYPDDPYAPHTPHQNFTVTVPDNLTSGGRARLSLVHLSLVGEGPFPLYQLKNVTLNVN